METLKKFSNLLAQQTSLFVIAVAVLAYFCPSLFSWVKGYYSLAIIAIIMFSMGLTITTENFKILMSRPLDIFIGAVAQYTIMPCLAWTIAKSFNLPNDIAVGLILVGCAPGGVSSNIMSFLCHGDVPFSVGMTTASTLLAPVMTPILMLLLAGERVDVPAAGMFLSILETVLVPVALGFFLNRFYGRTKTFKDVQQVMPSVAVIGLALIVGGVTSLQGKNFFTAGVVVFLAVFCHNSVGYVLGYLVGRFFGMSTAKKRTLSIEVGMQNAGLATGLASVHLAMYPHAALAAAVSCVWHSISGTLLANFFARVDLRREKAAAGEGAQAAAD
ncbi:MAG: bile acid:sodium symporter family protein [Aeromonadales bacterium]|nr:bile acid:sodium symporter family protein [Aeromonadales bacterium]MDY2890778.1 bile acid:sodium symporter family protein [Succinivibrio sp.]